MIIVGHFLKRAIYYLSHVVIQEKIVANLFGLNCVSRNRVCKGNSRGIRDSTKLRCEKKQNILTGFGN